MSLESIMNSSAAMRLAIGATKVIPQGGIEKVAAKLARRLIRDEADIARAVRLNQWVVSGGTLRGEELDRAVEETLAHGARIQYELIRYFKDLSALEEMVIVDESMLAVMEETERGDRGIIGVGPHLGNFDMVIHSLGHRGWRAQVLSIPDPDDTNRWQNEQRESAGLELTPMSKESISQALEGLRDGRTVATGLDRPIDARRYMPRFFGRVAPLPVTHVRLAFKTEAPVYVVSCQRQPDERYRVIADGPFELERGAGGVEDTVREAERLLAVAEKRILEAPRQWAMFYPVWPDVMDLVL